MSTHRSRRRKKVHHEEAENHDRWVISYADFITLLFAFFVVMYSISSVNEGKYRVLSDSLVTSFSKPVAGVLLLETTGQTSENSIVLKNQNPDNTAESFNTPSDDVESERSIEEKIQLNEISGKIERMFFNEITNKNISVKNNDEWIEVEIKSSLLFPSGVAELNPEARPVIKSLAEILKDYENPVQIEGFTDNVPINTMIFSSNWALSSARAVAVVQLLTEAGVKPHRLAAIGYGEFQPITDNSSEEGRKMNRRVTFIISKGKQVRKQMSNKEALESYFSKGSPSRK